MYVCCYTCLCCYLVYADTRANTPIFQDKLERLAAKGIKPEEAAAAAKTEKPPDPYKERKINLASKLRDIIGFHRNDPTTPNPGTKVSIHLYTYTSISMSHTSISISTTEYVYLSV